MARPLTDPPGPTAPRLPRWLASFCWLLLAGVLFRLGGIAAEQLRAPFDLVYESPNLASVEVIRLGANPYDPRVYDATPFVLTIYTPLYHELVAALPAADGNPFFTGRVVALLCMLGSAALLFAAVPRDRARAAGVFTSYAAAALAAAVFLAHWPVTSNAALLKNDPLALLCAGAAVVLVARGSALAARGTLAPSRLTGAVLPAVLCVLALAAKQSYVAAAVACALHLLLADMRRARTFLLALAASGAAFALFASLAWGKGFWFCTLTATHHPLSLQGARMVAAQIFRQPLACVLLAFTVLTALAALRGGALAALRASPALPWVACSALVLALTIGKQGASTNYVFELALAQSLWLATWLSGRAAPARRLAPARLAPALVACGALVAVTGGDMLLASRQDCAFIDDAVRAQRLALEADVKGRVARLAGPDARVLDLFSSLHTFNVQRQGFLNDPFLYSILWEEGTLSPAPLVAALRRGDADVVLLPAGLDPRTPLAGPTGQVLAAVLQNYRLAERSERHAYYTRARR